MNSIFLALYILIAVVGIALFKHIYRQVKEREALRSVFSESMKNGSLPRVAAIFHDNPNTFIESIQTIIVNTNVPQAISEKYRHAIKQSRNSGFALVKTVLWYIDNFPEEAQVFVLQEA